MTLFKKLIKILLITNILITPHIAIASGGIDMSELFSHSISYSSAKSETENGSNLEVALQMFIAVNLAISQTRLASESITNKFIGVNYPIFHDSNSRDQKISFLFFNFGSGQKGSVHKLGIKISLSKLFNIDIPLGLTLSREIYLNNSELNNTQIGLIAFKF